MNDNFGQGPDSEARRQSAELLKDLMMEQKRSRWPLILAVMALLACLGGGAYWYYLPPERRPPLETLGAKVVAQVKSLLNKPVMGSSAANPNAALPNTQQLIPSTSTESTGLLSD